MTAEHLTIAWICPELLGTYGDRGNVIALVSRARARAIPIRVVRVDAGQPVPESADIHILGGGEDLAQEEVARQLGNDRGLRRAAEAGRVVFGVCAGYQLLGTSFVTHDGRTADGLGLLDIRSEHAARRAVGELLGTVPAPLSLPPVTGFENHRGTTVLSGDTRPLARTMVGVGNGDGTEGGFHRHIMGTYLHGPALVRNPALADLLLSWATGGSLPVMNDPWTEGLRSERLTALGHKPVTCIETEGAAK
ncbi:type 1 glutamine amidotransferase [Streptomyces sp. NPDC058665]|uniref:type 1 glutamine amidotransferase n=1 Tax=Streptomyces sp. NPDC058665 TaxID=3346586 RepID=UPI00365424E7